MSTKVLYLLTLVFSVTASAQHSEEETDKFSPKIIPPSPVAAGLGNYGNIPIGMSTGSPNVNLDIYTLKENGIAIPISLSYSSNGVQVDATSKQLGIDWNLIVGGVITRQVNNDDDFKTAWSVPDESRICIPSDLSAIALNAHPPQKDIFSYSAPGISGKFIVDGNSFRELNPTDNKIEAIFVRDSNGQNVRVLKITSVDGTEYYFGENSQKEISSNVSYCGSPSPDFSETAYLLTRIKTASGQEAYFKYISQAFSSTTYQQKGNSITVDSSLPTTAGIGTPCSTIERHTTFFVEWIELNDKRIKFEYEDLESNYNYQESKQLRRIKIYSNINKLYKSFSFNYDGILPNSSLGLNAYTKTDRKRYFLKEVLENNSTEQQSITKYSFDYYNPGGLPPKNSYSKDIFGYYNGKNNTNMLFNNLGPLSPLYTVFKNAGTADRNPNESVIHFGMLKSITYPTKGRTAFEYEPNSVYIEKTFYPTPTVIPYGAVAGPKTTNVCIDFSVPFSQKVDLYGTATVVLDGVSPCNDSYPNWTPISNVSVYKRDGSTIGQLVTKLIASPIGTLKFDLDQGDYYLCVSTNRPCVESYGSITYFKTPPEKRMVNDPVAGVRVKKTIDYDNRGNETIKKYYYGDWNCLTCSSGTFAISNPFSEPNIDLFTNTNKRTYTMFSNSKMPLNSFDGSSLSYNTVIESFGENFENGGIAHYFITKSDEYPVAICDEYIRGTPFSNGFQGGTEYKTVVFKKEGNLKIDLSVDESIFTLDESRNFAVNNYTTRLYQTILNPSGLGQSTTDYFYNFNVYQTRSQIYNLSKKISTKFDRNGLNPVILTTDYKYTGSNHLQLTSQILTNSQNEKLETKYFYAKDTEMASEPLRYELLAKNMVGLPLREESYRGGNKLSEKRTQYGSFPSSTANQPNILPQYVYAKKGNVVPDQLEKKVTYDSYSAFGNLTQYTIENGIPVSIIWGYSQTLPIAKIENATNAQVASALGVSDLYSINETNLAAINALRNALPNAMVTTYTYIPLVGISTITDPKGDTATYTYDSFGRLESVRDGKGLILSENQYNYKQ